MELTKTSYSTCRNMIECFTTYARRRGAAAVTDNFLLLRCNGPLEESPRSRSSLLHRRFVGRRQKEHTISLLSQILRRQSLVNEKINWEMESRHASLGRRTVLISSSYCAYSKLSMFSVWFCSFQPLIRSSDDYFCNFLQLEDIRQKRAAERLSKISSGPDLTKIPNGIDSCFLVSTINFLLYIVVVAAVRCSCYWYQEIGKCKSTFGGTNVFASFLRKNWWNYATNIP